MVMNTRNPTNNAPAIYEVCDKSARHFAEQIRILHADVVSECQHQHCTEPVNVFHTPPVMVEPVTHIIEQLIVIRRTQVFTYSSLPMTVLHIKLSTRISPRNPSQSPMLVSE